MDKSESPQTSASPPALDYASPETECKVGYLRDGEGAMISIPSPLRRRLEAATHSAMILFVNGLFLLVVGGGIARVSDFGWALPAVCTLPAATFLVAWLWHRRLSDAMVVEVTAQVVVFHNLSRELRMHSLPREAVYDVRYVSHSGNLVIRARGHEILEWRPVENERELERMAAFLRQALGVGQPSEAASARFPHRQSADRGATSVDP